jgi:hypothetical protein
MTPGHIPGVEPSHLDAKKAAMLNQQCVRQIPKVIRVIWVPGCFE